MKRTTKALWLILISVFLASALISCALDIPGLSANNPSENSGEKESSKNPQNNGSNPEEETENECTHDWNVVTTEPTCQNKGYDTKTCTLCGQTEKCNEVPITSHDYSEEYEVDGSFHWNKCKTCDLTSNREEHDSTVGGVCSVCSKPFSETEGIIFELSENGDYALVIGYTGEAKKVNIAESYEGKPVKVISEGAFKGKAITSVVIPNSVTEICPNAFNSCTSLVSVTVGNNITSVGYRAFHACNPNLYTKEKNSKGTITATYVGDTNNPYTILINGYGECKINEKTKVIAGHAFMETGDRELVIPDGVTAISNQAFFYSYFNRIIIPDSVTAIGERAFEMCRMLDTVILGDGITEINAYTFTDCYYLRFLTIPDSVTAIGENAFYSCVSLEAVTIGKNLTKIGKSAFDGCGSIISVNYAGSEENFAKIIIEEKNSTLTNAIINYNYTEE